MTRMWYGLHACLQSLQGKLTDDGSLLQCWRDHPFLSRNKPKITQLTSDQSR